MITYRDVLNAKSILINLAKAKFSPKLALRLAVALEQLFAALDRFEKIKAPLVKTYFKVEANAVVFDEETGEAVLLEGMDFATFKKEMDEALDTEIEGLTYFRPFKAAHWPKSFELAPQEASALMAVGLLEREE